LSNIFDIRFGKAVEKLWKSCGKAAEKLLGKSWGKAREKLWKSCGKAVAFDALLGRYTAL